MYVTGTPIFGLPPEPISDVALRICAVYCVSFVMTLQSRPSWELFHPCSQGRVGVGRWINRHTKICTVGMATHQSCYLRPKLSHLGVTGVGLGGGVGSRVDGTGGTPAGCAG